MLFGYLLQLTESSGKKAPGQGSKGSSSSYGLEHCK